MGAMVVTYTHAGQGQKSLDSKVRSGFPQQINTDDLIDCEKTTSE